jgi:hypothetical protein
MTLFIEFARRGEYDHALNFFEQAKAGMEDRCWGVSSSPYRPWR